MNLCDSGHDEVCYESRKCPVCEKQLEITEMEEMIANRDKVIDELREELKIAYEGE